MKITVTYEIEAEGLVEFIRKMQAAMDIAMEPPQPSEDDYDPRFN